MNPVERADVLSSAPADTIALHERVKNGDPGPVLEAAATIAASLRAGRTLLHVICELGESAFVA